ncbi:hypothetical protein NC653_038889 [Populus alba x Populus x berolinensis]|uniref:Uncharacterized protein n=1 Tax=Populus alba x Populus x berolinensis TaxID=444605 RepID=A0AAD6PQ00_9ROSI|nr:hypothetical protein NC653_038889 [Populus alba x Populus x berolinensis]
MVAITFVTTRPQSPHATATCFLLLSGVPLCLLVDVETLIPIPFSSLSISCTFFGGK